MLVLTISPKKRLEISSEGEKIVIRAKKKSTLYLEIDKSVKFKLVKNDEESKENRS